MHIHLASAFLSLISTLQPVGVGHQNEWRYVTMLKSNQLRPQRCHMLPHTQQHRVLAVEKLWQGISGSPPSSVYCMLPERG